MSCNQCGMCCKALVVPVSQYEARRYIRQNYPFKKFTEEEAMQNDMALIANFLKPISHEEAIKINPHLKEWDLDDSYTYSCPFLLKGNKCKFQGQKNEGAMCDGFPFYGRIPKPDDLLYSEDCGFKSEIIEIRS